MNPFDLLRPRGLPIRVRSSYVSEWMCRPRSRRFDSCAPCRDHRACCVWSPRARERHSPRPAREVRAGVIWQRAGRVALGARHWSGQLLQPAGRTPARLWPPAFGRTPSRRTTQPRQPDRALPKWAHRHGHNLFRGQPPARRQSQRTVRSPKVVTQRILSKGPWAVNGRQSETRLREAG